MMTGTNSEKNKSLLGRIADFFRGIINVIKSSFGIDKENAARQKLADEKSGMPNTDSSVYLPPPVTTGPPEMVKKPPQILVEDIRKAHNELSGDNPHSFKWRVYAVLELYTKNNGVNLEEMTLEVDYPGLSAPGQEEGAIYILCDDIGMNTSVQSEQDTKARGEIAEVLGVSSDKITSDFLNRIGSENPQTAADALNEVVLNSTSPGPR